MSERRQLNAFDATMLVMGGIIGVGIFYNPAQVARFVPDPAWFLAMWAIGGAIALCGAQTFAELGGSFPKAGGWYVFLREAFGPFLAFLFAWIVLGVVSTGAIAVMVQIGVENLAGIVPGIGAPGSASSKVAGALVIALVTGLTMLGAKAGATLQNVCMIAKLVAIGALVVAAWLFFGPSRADAPITTAPATGSLASGAVRALMPVLFSCGGWQLLCYVAPQVRDPQRTLPRAIVLGVLGVVTVYLAINASYLRVLGIDGLADTSRPFAGEMARVTLGATGGEILRAAMGVSAIGVCIVTILASPWLYVAMAREGLFFRRFGEVSARTGAPVAALFVQGVLAIAYWLWGEAGQLVDSVVFVEWIFHGLVAVALLRLRAQRPTLERPFRSWLYPLAPIVYLLVAVAVVAGNLALSDGRATLLGLGCIVLGALVYKPWRALVGATAR